MITSRSAHIGVVENVSDRGKGLLEGAPILHHDRPGGGPHALQNRAIVEQSGYFRR